MTTELLSELNSQKVYSVEDEEFRTYGRVLHGFDFSEIEKYMIDCTTVPSIGNVYVPSVPEMEKKAIFNVIKNTVYGGMNIQIGYCNGVNSTFNGFEYHKGSEVNVAVTDFCLVLGHSYDIKDNRYNVDDAKIFFVKKGTAIEMYQTTLHLSPCKTEDSGFRDIVILPKGTNTPLEAEVDGKGEAKLLLMKNKWIIAHPDREPLIKQGAYPGVVGENKEVKYRK